MKNWEIIADRLSKAGCSWGWVSAVDSQGRTIWIVDAHRGDGQRFVAGFILDNSLPPGLSKTLGFR
jgi:hypothetical protein